MVGEAPLSVQEKTVSAILVVEKDPVFGAVLEDRLHVAGHEVELLMDRERAVQKTLAGQADLLILEILQPGNAGLDIVGDLRGRAETRALPILVLSRSVESVDRVAALRAGADDYLTKPCDLEELVLRAERLVESRGVQAPLLQGDLANHPLWELVQYVQQTAKSGSLVLRGPAGNGSIGFRAGQVVDAKWAELPRREALLALLGMKKGRFRFAASEENGSTREALLLSEALMQVAWLEDELENRRDLLPGTGVPLSVASGEVPALGEDDELTSAGLPFVEVFDLLRKNPGWRLFDIVAELPVAPQKVRLAVAWLVEKEAVSPPDDDALDSYPSTGEITSTQLMDLSVQELLVAAREAGFGTSALPFLIAFEPGVKAELVALLQRVPGFPHNEPLRALVLELTTSKACKTIFATEAGKLVLHLQELDPEVSGELEGVVTVAAGVLLWLDDGSASEVLRRLVVERLDASAAATGVLVATSPQIRALAEKLVADRRHWQVSTHAPQSLLGVLRLLQPVAEKS